MGDTVCGDRSSQARAFTEVARLERIVASLATAAHDSGVRVVAGDTKVVRRGEASGLYLVTTGVGVRPRGLRLGLGEVREGDTIIVSGPLGDHGTAVLLAREEFGRRGDLASDAASVLPLAQALLGVQGLRFMRDPTRGGVASALNEIAAAAGIGIVLEEHLLPIPGPVAAACEMLGFDPLYVANEGLLVAFVPDAQADEAVNALRSHPLGRAATRIGRCVREHAGLVILKTGVGGNRVVDMLPGDQLPRIC